MRVTTNKNVSISVTQKGMVIVRTSWEQEEKYEAFDEAFTSFEEASAYVKEFLGL